jgi:hypothetical protein
MKMNSKLVSDCHQSLVPLTKQNRVQLIWVTCHAGIVGTDTAIQLAKLGSKCPFIGPKPACTISVWVAKKAVADWTKTTFKNGIDSPICKRYLEKDKSATHILRECEAIAYLRICQLGHYFMRYAYHDIPVSRIWMCLGMW